MHDFGKELNEQLKTRDKKTVSVDLIIQTVESSSSLRFLIGTGRANPLRDE